MWELRKQKGRQDRRERMRKREAECGESGVFKQNRKSEFGIKSPKKTEAESCLKGILSPSV